MIEEKKEEKKPVEELKKSPSPEKGDAPEFVEVYSDLVSCMLSYCISSVLSWKQASIHCLKFNS